MAGPLDGIKVLDLSRILAGPWATQVFADYGARVIKIEQPGQGDDTRHWGPPYLTSEFSEAKVAAYFLAANRGKQSLAIDFTKPQGQEIILSLLKDCDILVENYKVGSLKKYSLDYTAVQKVNPRLIYCSITGFGQTGPDANKPGYDAIIQGMGGLMSVTGERDDKPGGGPQKVGVAVADLMTGMYAVSAVLAALFHRERSGEGQYIDLSLLDCQVALMANQNMNYLVSGQPPQRQGTGHPSIVPYQAVKARDGYFMLAVGNDQQFARFCIAIDRESLASDARYATNAARVANRETLLNEIETVLAHQDIHIWIGSITRVGVPCGPINNLAEVFAEPQVKAREMLFELPHRDFGAIKQVANPVKFSQTTNEYHQAPPALGEHSKQILLELGCDEKTLENLSQLGIISF